jgi:hypothetical protein
LTNTLTYSTMALYTGNCWVAFVNADGHDAIYEDRKDQSGRAR